LFLGEPSRTQFDVNFSLFGFPIRVTPFFWVVALVLGYNLCQDEPIWLLLWIGAVFLSILIHELGHALAFRRYSIGAHVVLYHFGGVAVPSSSFSGFGFGGNLSPKQQIVISAAGPGAQLMLAACVYGAVRLSGYTLGIEISETHYIPAGLLFLSQEVLWGGFEPLPNQSLQVLFTFLFLPSVYWALLNLLPVYPLDGGQIAREIFTVSDARGGIKNSLILSIVTAVGLAIYALTRQPPQTFMAILFGMLAFTSYQALQAHTGGGGGFGGWRGGRGGGGW